MTAEILIMNKHAIALAADSVVTVNEEITYEGVNKLFMLSNDPPMGIMIYGSAEFMGIPMETLIKEYKKTANFQEKNSVDTIVEDFLKFLETSFKKYIEPTFTFENPTFEDFNEIISNEIETDFDSFYGGIWDINYHISDKLLTSFKESGFFDNDEATFKELSEKLPYDDKGVIIDLLKKRCIGGLTSTGIVVAGFNSEDIFPSFSENEIYFVFNNKLIFNKVQEVLNINGSLIRPFAQRDVVDNFLFGMDLNIINSLKNFLKATLDNYENSILDVVASNNKIKLNKINQIKEDIKQVTENNDEILESFDELINKIIEQYTTPILGAIDALPKDELGNMCESLIHITSLKRKVSGGLPTVGGDIDVAIISKGDGFVWMKRKHYFDVKFNPHFLKK